MTEPRDTMVALKLTGRERLELERASKLERTTLSDFVRTAVLPAARDTIVAHAIKAPMGDAA